MPRLFQFTFIRHAVLLAALCFPICLTACQSADQTGEGGNGDAATAAVPAADQDGAAGGVAGSSATLPSGDASAPAAPAGDLVADVDGAPITLAEFQRQAFDTQRFYVDKGVDPNTDDGQRQLLFLRRQVLDDMINQKLMELAADEMGMNVTDAELEASISETVKASGGQDQFDATLTQTGSTLEEFRRMQASALIGKKMMDEVIAKDVPTTAEARHARHILCPAEADCQAALTRLESGEAFDQVALAVSADEATKNHGGDLGWLTRGGLVAKEVENAAFRLQAGQRSPVVKSDLGYHVVEVVEVNPAWKVPDEQLNDLKSRKLIDWFTERRKQAKITIFLDDLKDLVNDAGQPASPATSATP